MKCYAYCAAIFCAVTTHAISASASASPLCNAAEQTLWHCTLKYHKMSAICASKDLSATAGYLQYRFGTRDKIELEFPTIRKQTQQQFRYSRYFRYQTQYDSVRFVNNGYNYALNYYAAGDVGASLLETVTLSLGKEKEMQCLEKSSSASIYKLENILPNEDFLK
jgi:hypothetical protein